ncbi:MAG: ABC transporter ATP-binding protein [Lachnospiraceae bacterium]|nr:ABC transporter ATP-binding protein [Lachnospiraceae bacterium]
MKITLEVKEISKEYNDFALESISFALEEGTITGFIGENGAGKTTTFSAIMNIIRVDSGEVLLNGKKIKSAKDIGKISYLESSRDLYPGVYMKEYKNLVRRIYKKTWSEDKYKYYEKAFHIEKNKKIKELSTGMKSKFYLAVELAKQPEVMLLDEPTAGLDPIARNELLDIIHRLSKEDKMTILFSSHITSDIEHIADRVIFIHEGKLLLNMNKEEINNKYKIVFNRDFERVGEEQIG